MKKATAVVGGALAMMFLAGPGFAQTATQTPPPGMTFSQPAETTPPAKKPGMLSMSHRVSGDIVTSDASNNVLTVKTAKGKDYTFAADSDTAGQLANLRQGDHVKVTYKKKHDQMIATKIVQTPGRTR